MHRPGFSLALALIALVGALGPPRAVGAAGNPGVVRLMAVGDVMLARSIGDRIVLNGPSAPWLGVVADFAAADLVVANLECTISERGTPWQKRNRFRAPLEAADSLVAAQIDVVNLANNHSLDYGVTAFMDTLELLDTNGIRHIGGGHNRAAARAPVIVAQNGLRIAFLGYILPNHGPKLWYPEEWNASQYGAGLAVGTPEAVAADVAAVRLRVHAVVVSFHGGLENRTAQSAQVRDFARAAVGAGAKLVIGHHPHVLQGYHREGSSLIAYSLGTFVMDGRTGPSTDSVILDVTITASGVQSFSWIAIVLKDGFPRRATGAEIARVMARVPPLP